MTLSKTEEQLMEILWKLDKAFMKEILDEFDDPIPANSTILTLLKRMQDKGYVAYQTFGNSRQYYTLVSKDAYFQNRVNGMIKNFFNNSPLQFASFFTKSTDLSKTELEELKNIIDEKLHNKLP